MFKSWSCQTSSPHQVVPFTLVVLTLLAINLSLHSIIVNTFERWSKYFIRCLKSTANCLTVYTYKAVFNVSRCNYGFGRAIGVSSIDKKGRPYCFIFWKRPDYLDNNKFVLKTNLVTSFWQGFRLMLLVLCMGY